MKKRYVLTMFLMLLYIAPLVFAPSYSNTTIAPNKTKDFNVAYEAHEESIDTFAETLPDNTLFFPDAFTNTTLHFADGGSEDYVNTFEVDSVYLQVDPPPETLEFWTDTEYRIEGFIYHIYGYGINPPNYFDVSDDGGLNTVEEIGTLGWYNGTYYFENITDYNNISFTLTAGASGGPMKIDYVDIQIISMTAYSSDVYCTSFSNVSKWALRNCEADATLTCDTDTFIFETDVGASDSDSIRSDIVDSSFQGYYHEVSLWSNVSCTALVTYYDTTPSATIDSFSIVLSANTWTPHKSYFEGVGTVGWIYVTLNNQNKAIQLKGDFLRCSPSNETGYQHDCSNIENTYTNGLLSSDGSNINFTADDNLDRMYFYVDGSATRSIIDTDYYPFIEFTISSVSGGLVRVDVIDSLGSSSTVHAYSSSTGTFRYNMESVKTDLDFIRVYLDSSGATVIFENMNVYSIANFTYDDGGGESTNDYSYVSNEKLYIHTDTYTKWNYDPPLNVSIAIYYNWTAIIEGDDSGFRFRELQDTNTLFDTGVTSGGLVGTYLEDFDILIYSDCVITAIDFYNPVEWHIVDTVTVWILVPFDYWAFDMFLLFLGLIMVILSAVYGAYKIKNNPDRQTMIIVMLLFIFGWALFFGGIGIVGGG